jgi:hypothetical protein
MKRLLAVLVLALATTFALGGAQDALAAASAGPVPRGPSEIFATNNTAIITDPNDPRLDTRLVGFEVQVDSLIRQGGAQPRRSLLVDGVFWSSDLQQTTYETSREFDVARATPTELHAIADTIRVQFRQESVLTFRLLPQASPDVNAVQIETPGIDVQRLHDGLVANPAIRDELVGGSVTRQHELILIASLDDLALAQQFIASIGGSAATSTIQYGADEFVG